MILDHHCARCGHPQLWGQPGTHPVLGLTRPAGCGQPDCACRAGKCQWNPQPAIIPRIDADGTPITDVVAPGSDLPFYTARRACDCDACKTLHAQLTAHPEGTQP